MSKAVPGGAAVMEAARAVMEQRGCVQSFEAPGLVAAHMGFSRHSDTNVDRIQVESFDRKVSNAFYKMASAGDVVRAGRSEPGPDGVRKLHVRYWTHAAAEQARKEAAERTRASNELKAAWGEIRAELDRRGYVPGGAPYHSPSLSIDDWQHLLQLGDTK